METLEPPDINISFEQRDRSTGEGGRELSKIHPDWIDFFGKKVLDFLVLDMKLRIAEQEMSSASGEAWRTPGTPDSEFHKRTQDLVISEGRSILSLLENAGISLTSGEGKIDEAEIQSVISFHHNQQLALHGDMTPEKADEIISKVFGD